MSEEAQELDGPDWDAIDEIVVDMDVIKDKIAKREAGGGGGNRDRYFVGRGDSDVRFLPFWSSDTGGWDVARQVHYHKRFDGKDVLCVRQMKGEKCEICELYFELGKDKDLFPGGFKDDKFKRFARSSGLQPVEDVWVNLQVIRDCGSKGDGGFNRPQYEAGQVCFASLNYTLYAKFLSIYGDSMYAAMTSPTKGRHCKISLTRDPQTQRNAYDLKPHPDASPIADSKAGIKEILEKCWDFSKWYAEPDEDRRGKISLKIEALREKAYAPTEDSKPPADTEPESATTPPDDPIDTETQKPKVPEGDDGVSSEDEEVYVPASKADKPDVKVTDVKPSNRKDADGNRICFNRGAKDDANAECQLCELDVKCDVK